MSEDSNAPSAIKPASGILTFEFRRSNLFRIVHADGVFGGVTPNGYVLASFFSQMAPIPTSIDHEFDGRTIGAEVARQGPTNVVRELEVGVMMDLAIAKSLLDWLKEKVDMLEKEKGS